MKNLSFEHNLRPSVSENNGIGLLLDQDQKIYSVGISTGGAAEIRMALANSSRKIIATTIDPAGAAFAKQKIEEERLSLRIEVKVEDVARPLSYPDGFFDFVYARLVLHYLPMNELDPALKELHRVLRKDGKIFVVVRSSRCAEVYDKEATFDPISRMTTYVSEGHSYKRYFHTEESIQSHLESSGFRINYIKTYEERLCVDFQRTQLSRQVDTLIEVFAVRKD